MPIFIQVMNIWCSDNLSIFAIIEYFQFECCAINAVINATNDYDSTPWQSGSPATDIPISCCPGVTSSNYTIGTATDPLCPSLQTVDPSGQYSKVVLRKKLKSMKCIAIY